jgi:hypothetical protein
MLRYIVSKIVEEIVKSPQNKRFIDGLPDGLKDAYKDHDKDGVINYLDKDVDPATKAEWKRGFKEYASGKGDFKQDVWDNSKTDSVYNKVDREVLSSGVATYVRGVIFVIVAGYIIISLILRS